jgi:hypothetical protein
LSRFMLEEAVFSQKLRDEVLHEIDKLIECVRLDDKSRDITLGIKDACLVIPMSDDMKM